ncbi:ThiF family adenylyltransferase [Moorellaceae bacterium AZ2]
MRFRVDFSQQDPAVLPYFGTRPLRARFVIVGLGGTGGYVFYYLSRLVASLRRADPARADYQIVLADGDVVEEKNMVRQNFIEADLGRPKVEVLSERYGAVYDMLIPYHPRYVEDPATLVHLLCDELAGFSPTISVLVGCVDNNRSRQLFHQVFDSLDSLPLVYVDSGNDEWSGQVILGARSEKEIILPPVGYYYPDILQDEDTLFPSEESCQQRAVSSPQNIATNVMAGTLVFSLLNQLFAGEGLEVYGVTFNARTGQTRALYLDQNSFLAGREHSLVQHYPFCWEN